MTFQIWRSQVIKHSQADLTWPRCPDPSELSLTHNVLHMYTNELLTQWAFHRVQEHQKRSSNEEVMTFQSWRSHVIKHSQADLTWPRCPDLSELILTPTVLHRYTNGILTQWDFHRVQEHPKWSSNEEVMTFQIWRSHVIKHSQADLTWPRCPNRSELVLTPNVLHRYTNGILTQWDFHRVQEHPERSSDEEVMTFQSWRSHGIKHRQADLTWPRCPDLSEIGLTPTVLHMYINGILTQ